MKSTNRDLTWDAINGITILLTMVGLSGSILSNLIILDGINNDYWFIPYSLFGFAFCLFKYKTGCFEIL